MTWAQGLPVAAWADGHLSEFLLFEGVTRWTTQADRVKTGIAAPRVSPGETDYFGITFGEFATLGASSLVIDAFLEGNV